MSGARITIDGLWRCLCSSIDAAVARSITTARIRPQLRKPAPTALQNTPGPRCLHATGRRRQHGAHSEKDPFASLASAVDEKTPVKGGNAPNWTEELRQMEESPDHVTSRPTDRTESRIDSSSQPLVEPTSGEQISENLETPKISSDASQRQGTPSEMVQRLVLGKWLHEDMPRATSEEIYEALRRTRVSGRPRHRRTTAALVKHLLASGTAPNTFIYETLLMAHAAIDGSADTVKELLREMRQKKLPWSSTAYHAALQALAVHPDYLLRNTIIKEMKERWLEISPEGHQHIAIGLLRDEQYELALEKLREMSDSGIQIEGWVCDIFIYVFGKMGFLDEALRIVRHRLDSGQEIPVNVWYFLLDVCSKGQRIEATRFVWNRAVQPGIVNPSDGVALNVLNMAAVYGDTDLCTPVIEYLASRGTRLNRYHYEALIDAYAAQGNVEKALEVYCIMQAAGVEVNNSSTSSLAFALTRDPSLIDKAIQAMSGLREKHNVPITIFNSVLNEIVKADAEQSDDAFARALALYRRIREFVPDGPDSATFRNLLWKCTRTELAQFFAGEMVHFKIRPNLTIIKHMYRIHVEFDGPSHRAKDYFFKVAPYFREDLSQGLGKAEVMDLSVKLIKRLIGERDSEAWRILDICRENGLEEGTIRALRAEVEAGAIEGADAASRNESFDNQTGLGAGDSVQPSA
ncbi:hypothetical protein Daus18300_001657 [Diaporthe australafricana]|uniref:Pentatricopeptide repeat-containing protein-mitochondrial domain-containing protein n=1 Tax=Diaporthe australafricana TaxID=127596 RepID=A0ABR3XUY6_9PEZI